MRKDGEEKHRHHAVRDYQRRQPGFEQRAQGRRRQYRGGGDGARHHQNLRFDGEPGVFREPGGGDCREQRVGLEIAFGSGVITDLEQPQDALGQHGAEQREGSETQVLEQAEPEQRTDPGMRDQESAAERRAKNGYQRRREAVGGAQGPVVGYPLQIRRVHHRSVRAAGIRSSR